MPSSFIQLPKNLIEDSFYTKSNMPITFDCYHYFSEELDNIPFNYTAVQALVDNEVAGYILISYLSQETKDKFFQSPLDYFIYYHASEEVKSFYYQKQYDKVQDIILKNNKFLEISDIYKSLLCEKYEECKIENLSLQTLELFAHKHYFTKHSNFITQWLNKPNVEMICVYNELDKKVKNFTSYPFTQEVRENLISFRGQGIAQSLYAKAGSILQQNNLHLYASNTQTSNGQKMWSILENHPKFQVCLDSYAVYLQPSQIIQRKKLITL